MRAELRPEPSLPDARLLAGLVPWTSNGALCSRSMLCTAGGSLLLASSDVLEVILNQMVATVLSRLFLLLLATWSFSSTQACVDIVINEVMSRPGNGEDWIELYNPSNEPVTLHNCVADDVLSGGMSPIEIADTVMEPHTFYVVELENGLDTGKDEVYLICSGEVIDFFQYSKGGDMDVSYQRVPDGGPWSAYQSPSSKGRQNTGKQDTPWTPGKFEIRIFDVEQADSQLIIFPSGYSILVDCGESSGSDAMARRVSTKLKVILGSLYVDVAVLTHLHSDHIGFPGTGGFWALLEKFGVSFGKLIDRDSGSFRDGANGGEVDGVCDYMLPELDWYNAGKVSGTARRWLCYATHNTSRVYSIRENAELGSSCQISPPDDSAEVVITAADGLGLQPNISGDRTEQNVPPGENEYSIGLLVRFGQLRYHTAGDAGGFDETSQFGYTYRDIESLMVEQIKGRVNILRVNHHGSGHSTNQYFIDSLEPTVGIISCGANSYGHPSQDVLDRLVKKGVQVYQTNMGDTTRDYSGLRSIVNGDVLIASINCSHYSVNGDVYNVTERPISRPLPPRPTLPPGTVRPDLYEVIINEFAAKPNPEFVELYNPTTKVIDLSGAMIDDIANGGQEPLRISNGTVLEPGGFFVQWMNSFLNNGGDTVRLLQPDGLSVIDERSYTQAAPSGLSYSRCPDGGGWRSQATERSEGFPNHC